MTDENLTDLGNARRLIRRSGQDFRYVPAWGAWLTWDGRRWIPDTKGAIVEAAKQVPLTLLDEARELPDDLRRQFTKWSLASEAANRIEATIKLARTEPGIPVDPDELDRNHWLLVVDNGTLDLRTGQLGPHRRDDLATKLAPIAYDPSAAAPVWTQFLERILPDPDVREFVQRFLGYCLTGSVAEQKIMFAFGAGANGKSTMFNAIERIMGDYSSQAAPDLVMRRRDDPHPTGLADLHGSRLVLVSETAQGRSLDESLVKRLTGGERVKARRMHRDFFEFDPTHKFVLSTNHRPQIEGTDHGIWRRLRLVPFDVTIPDHEQDRHLDDKLASEAPGILRWAVDGANRWQGEGLTEPAAVLAATADYRGDMDTIGEFISDHCILAATLNARASDLFDTYTKWAHDSGETPVSQRKLGLALRGRGLTKHRSNGIWWSGIGLKAGTTHGTMEPTELGFDK